MARFRVSISEAGITPRSVTRRDALRLFVGAGLCATLLPGVASAESTQEKLDAARDEFDAAEAELDRIAKEYEAIAGELSETTAQVDDLTVQINKKQDEIDAKQDEIDAKQDEIDAKQDEIDAKQKLLGERMSSAYKAGSTSTLDLLLSSATFEELTSNIYYLDKISESDRAMIEEIRTLKEELEQERAELEQQKADLEQQKADLEADRAELEQLQEQQRGQLEEARAKQAESQELVDSLSAEVQELVEKRDKELAAAAQAAAEANKNQNTGGSTVVVGSGSLQDVINAAYSTPSPGSGLCAAWVNNVFRNAGVGSFYGNADDLYYRYCGYAVSEIRPGMIIAVNTVPYSWAAQLYGHIGIYLGNNIVRHNASGRLLDATLDQWVADYSVTSTVRCGWHGGIALS